MLNKTHPLARSQNHVKKKGLPRSGEFQWRLRFLSCPWKLVLLSAHAGSNEIRLLTPSQKMACSWSLPFHPGFSVSMGPVLLCSDQSGSSDLSLPTMSLWDENLPRMEQEFKYGPTIGKNNKTVKGGFLYILVCVSVCIRICVCGTQNTSDALHHVFWDRVSPWLIQSGWLTRESPEIHLSWSPLLVSAHFHAWLFYVGSGDWAQGLHS